MSKLTIFFYEIGKADLSLVGGKGANLGEMTRAGFCIPFGFCATTNAYKLFVEENGLLSFIAEKSKAANYENVATIGLEIREKFLASHMPKEVEQEITAATEKIGEDYFYAVRSSATAEDLAFASFAGQQDTYLNIKGAANILYNIKSCWASLFTDRAILYRLQNNIEHEKVLMSVVVQKMVRPAVSGIMFTADPVSFSRNIVSIDASYGLGEALVSGLVSPDIYKFSKNSGIISSKIIGEKKMAIIPNENGNTDKIEISGEKSNAQALTDNQIIKLAKLGMTIEKHYNAPQDIEWCLENDEIYIVQSRNITSLFPLPAPQPNDNSLHPYISFGHAQVMTTTMSPMGISIIQTMLPFNKAVKSSNDCKFLLPAAGRLYVDISPLLQFKPIRKKMPSFLKNVDALMGGALENLVNRPDFESQVHKDKKSLMQFIRFAAPVVLKSLRNLKFNDPTNNVAYVDSMIQSQIKAYTDEVNSLPEGIERLEGLSKIFKFDVVIKQVLPFVLPGLISLKSLQKNETEIFGNTNHSDLVFKGLEGNITTQLGLMMADVADKVRESSAILAEFENENYYTFFERLAKIQGHDDFKKLFDAFISKYGMRCASEIDIASKRWCENPEPLIKSILAIVRTAKHGVHNTEYADTIEAAKAASKQLIVDVKAKSPKNLKKVERLLHVFRNTMPVREHPKYLLVNWFMLAKKVVKDEAEKLVAGGLLEEISDVFYLNYWELCDIVRSQKSAISLVAIRKEEYTHFNKLSPPRIMTSDGEVITAQYNRENLPKDAIVGIPVSSGVIEGIAKVVLNPADSSVDKGEILVAPFTDPGWTPLFINSAGLVMEVGGLLTHGTVVAREYGIPAVVGVTDATKLIKTGQRIRVDGNAGFVIILEESEQSV